MAQALPADVISMVQLGLAIGYYIIVKNHHCTIE